MKQNLYGRKEGIVPEMVFIMTCNTLSHHEWCYAIHINIKRISVLHHGTMDFF